jgi:N-methylhydantoinase B
MSAHLDPVTLQVLGGALHATCEEMGAVLVRAAHSANIKERRDASTALFDRQGQMVAQAEHIPVHLGAMPESVLAVKDLQQAADDTWILNDPYRGGTHLPDITLVSPIFVDRRHVGFAASRAHHADVGGSTPGSMPADSTTLDDEGVVIPPALLVRAGELDRTLLESLTEQMRNPRQREADLRAQLAANRLASLRLAEISRRHGRDRLELAMADSLDYAERRTRACIGDFPDGVYRATDVLEDDARGQSDLEIAVTIRVRGEELDVDFSGTSPQSPGNLNCPLSVTRSAVYYVLRVLTDPDIPASAGAYRPVRISAPSGCLLNAQPPAAVVGGNVETSSRIADVLMLAFAQAIDVPALGQGTMNNVTLGNESFTYYETLGGGQGACPEADGPSAVHVAMSNTLNTPVEAIELEFPLRISEYGLRGGSGGAGAFRGGDGVVREIEALEEMDFSLLTDRRRHPPPGAAGGGAGARGRNLLRRAGSDDADELPSKARGRLMPGDRLRIETPGGGGFGPPSR